MEATQGICALVDIPPSIWRQDLERRDPSGHRFQDLTGRKFAHCEVVGLAGFLKQYPAWLCKCDCGNLFLVRANVLKQKEGGCGCRITTHGLSGTYWVTTYSGMIRRCYNPNDAGYDNYGGRGIKVCRRWLESIEAFAADMGPRPSDKHSIDRIDNEGDYEKANCRWATQQQQCMNRRGLRWIEHDGERLTISDWARRLDITRERLRQRVDKCIALGASLSEAITTPAGEVMPCVKDAKDARLEAKAELRAAGVGAGNKKTDSIAERMRHLLDGNVHHLMADEAAILADGQFDHAMRKVCGSLELLPNIRTLGNHILVRATPRAK
jgi:hypothetical protein